MTSEKKIIEETHKLYKEAIRYVSRMNDVSIRKAAFPTLLSYPEVKRILTRYEKEGLKIIRTLSYPEKGVVFQVKELIDECEDDASQPAAVYVSDYNLIVILYDGIPPKAVLVHEIQHFIDCKLGNMDGMLSELRAYVIADNASDIKTFKKYCSIAKKSAGESFNSRAVFNNLHVDEDENADLISHAGFDYTGLAFVVAYPFVCKASRALTKRLFKLTDGIQQRYGDQARKVVLERYCGLEEIIRPRVSMAGLYTMMIRPVERDEPNARFCETGFPQETVDLKEYSCRSLQKRALECLESIAKGN